MTITIFRRQSLVGVLCMLLSTAFHPATAAEVDADRMHRLQQELRCLVCQNQSIADSHAPLAADLRAELERLMLEGKTDNEIREWMVARYGDFVLYRPPFKPTTWALWIGPFVLLGIGALVIATLVRRRSPESNAAEEAAVIDPERLQAALKKGDDA